MLNGLILAAGLEIAISQANPFVHLLVSHGSTDKTRTIIEKSRHESAFFFNSNFPKPLVNITRKDSKFCKFFETEKAKNPKRIFHPN